MLVRYGKFSGGEDFGPDAGVIELDLMSGDDPGLLWGVRWQGGAQSRVAHWVAAVEGSGRGAFSRE